MKYKYIYYCFSEDGKGVSSARGATLRQKREAWKRHIEISPQRIHLIIRKPDNKLMNFYHPMDTIEELLDVY